MTTTARIDGIYVSPASGEAMQPRTEVQAFAGQGLEGDRFRQIEGWDTGDGRQMTLVARESLVDIEAETGIAIPAGKSRRNIITDGVQLNELVGRRFSLGDVVCEGVEVCQPCAKMGEVLNEDKAKVVKALVHRSGLRARILSGGTIHTGDTITIDPAPSARCRNPADDAVWPSRPHRQISILDRLRSPHEAAAGIYVRIPQFLQRPASVLPVEWQATSM